MRSTYLSAPASVSDPEPIGSGFKLPRWIRIHIRNPDPESEIELKKIHFFHKFFMIFTYF